LFIKKHWPLIKEDFYGLLTEFFDGLSCLRSNNCSITLVPKNSSPSSVNDYRLISLLGEPIKLITKLLANRVHGVIAQLVHVNQYGFIRQRTIQDCLAWPVQYLHLCHSSKKEIFILKLDFEKAFDKVEHHVILKMMQSKGFSQRWLHWIFSILSSSTSQVLLNGVLGKIIHCKCGVRYGDPLSPLLFVLAADLLQSINEAFHQNLIQLPIDNSFGQAFPIVQYANDTLIIMQADVRQLFFLKCLLHSFGESTGLKVNFNKSFIVPINVGEEKVSIHVGTLGCLVETMHFTYLGLPLGTTKPTVQDFLPMFSRIEKRIIGIASFTSYSGRLTLVNAVLSALPTYYMCILELPMEIIDQINKYRRQCFWRCNDLNKKGNCLAAWSKIQKPKSQGGLGVIDLQFKIELSYSSTFINFSTSKTYHGLI
jgi:hypothetical protein